MADDLGVSPKARQPKRQRLDPKITREQIVRAIKDIEVAGWETENDSIKYDLIYEGKRYPPKIVAKYANKIANGKFLEVSEFTGGEDTTNKYFRERGFEIDFKPRASDILVLNKVYSREDLKTQFKITDATINNGIFKPKNFSSVWLFITEEKTPDRTQYKDYFDDQILQFEGQTGRRTDHLLIDHEIEGNEIIVFYRKKKDEYPNYAFQNLGRFSYYSHTSNESIPGPTRFVLYPNDLLPEDEDITIGVAEKTQTYLPMVEGKERSRIQTYYERNPRLRVQAIKIHGTKCFICGFEFSKKYGPFGEGYIEIHHLIPHSSIKGEREIDPQKDLIPVCSNCHRMIHKPRDTWLSIVEMQKMIK